MENETLAMATGMLGDKTMIQVMPGLPSSNTKDVALEVLVPVGTNCTHCERLGGSR